MRRILVLLLLLSACGPGHDNPLDPENSGQTLSVVDFSTCTTEDGIKLEWSPIEDATQYSIYRSRSDSQFGRHNRVDQVPGGTYEDRGVLSEALYYYKVVPIYRDGLEGSLRQAPLQHGVPYAQIRGIEILGEETLTLGVAYTYSAIGRNERGYEVRVAPDWDTVPPMDARERVRSEKTDRGELSFTPLRLPPAEDNKHQIQIVARWSGLPETKKRVTVLPPRIPSLLKFDPEPPTEAIVGERYEFGVEALDTLSNVVPKASLKLVVTGPSKSAIPREIPDTGEDGRTEVPFTVGTEAGDYTIQVTCSSDESVTTSHEFAAIADSPGQIMVDPPGPITLRPGENKLFSIRVLDRYGNPCVGKDVRFEPANAAINPREPITDRDGEATATLSAWTLVDDYSVVAICEDESSGPVAIHVGDVLPEVLEKALNSPTSGTVGEQVVLAVGALDRHGNAASSASVRFSASDGQTADVSTGSDGIAHWRYKLNTKAGSHQATATVQVKEQYPSGFKPPDPVDFELEVLPGAPASIAVLSPDPYPLSKYSEGIVAQPLEKPLKVQVRDKYANPVNGIPVSFSFPGNGVPENSNGYKLHPDTRSTTWDDVLGEDGVATTLLLFGTAAGPYRVDARVQSVPMSALFELFAVAGSPDRIEKVSGDQQQATVAAVVPMALTVKVSDTYGNACDVEVTFTPREPAGNRLTSSTKDTGSDGEAEYTLEFGKSAGVYRVEATVQRPDGRSVAGSPVEFRLTATPSAAASASILSGNGQQGRSLSSLPEPLKVQVRDRYGNPVPDVSVSFVVDTRNGGVAPEEITTDDEGIATTAFTPAKVHAATECRITAKLEEDVPPVTFTESVLPLPRLSVEPLSLNFGADESSESNLLLTLVMELGRGSVNWRVDRKPEWVTRIEPSEGLLLDEPGGERVAITVTVDRTVPGLLPSQPNQDEIAISSEGQQIHVPVSIEVTRAVTIIVTDLRTGGHVPNARVALGSLQAQSTDGKGVVVFGNFREHEDFPLEISGLEGYFPYAGTVVVPESGDYEHRVVLRPFRNTKRNAPGLIDTPQYIAFSPPGLPGRAYVSSKRGRRIEVINTESNSVREPIDLDAEPGRLVHHPAYPQLYVTVPGGNGIFVIDTENAKKPVPVQVGNEPISLVVSAKGDRLYVVNRQRREGGNTAGDISVIQLEERPGRLKRPEDLKEDDVLGVDNVPHAIVATSDGYLYVSQEATDTVTVVSPALLIQSPLGVGDTPKDMALSPDEKHLYVSNTRGGGSISVIERPSHRVATWPIDSIPRGLIVTNDYQDVDTLYVVLGLSVLVLDVSTVDVLGRPVSGEIHGFISPSGIAVSPDGSKLYVADIDADQVIELGF